MKFGDFEILSLAEQRFRLDGGTMFGVIPKSLWNRALPADDQNLIPMVATLFVLKAHGKIMIFDIGLGDTLSEREKKIYGTDGISALDSGLAGLGLTPEKVDYVILTHLHTDHCGGAVRMVNGQYVPRFPKAKYLISRAEWEVALKPNERTAAVYVPERLRPIQEAGQVEFIDGSTELFPGIKAAHTGGHSEGHFALEMSSGGKQVWYYADIYPTQHHLRTPYIPATDVFPLTSMEVKRRTLPRLIKEDIILAFDHDVAMPFGRVKEVDGRMSVAPVSETETVRV